MNFLSIISALLALGLTRPALAASGSDWRSRRIYQVVTDRFARTDGSTTAACETGSGDWCGGTWAGLINRLDYIQNMGFDAIWISPITYQLQGLTVDGAAYHGYWQTNINEVEDHFGTAQDLKNLAAELHSRGMYLMVDIVVNHFAWQGSPDSVDYSTFVPFDSSSYFHSYCSNNYDPSDLTNLEQCWMGSTNVPLPDLKTEASNVSSVWNSWAAQIVSEYSIDGFRIDSIMEVNTDFWASFQSSAGIYSLGEAYNADSDVVCGYQDYLPGVFNYAMYFPLISAFSSTSGSMSNLADMINVVKAGGCADTSLLGTFSENHDQPRFASVNGDMALAKNVVTFTMLTDGIPVIYQGQEQHYNALGGSSTPYNREAVWLSGYNEDADLYVLLQLLNAARANAANQDSTYLTYQNYPIYTDSNVIAMRKGDMVTVLTNAGTSGSSYTLSLASGYDAGTEVTELVGCTTLTASDDGTLSVPMASGLPKVYYPTASLGNGLCGVSSKRRGMKVRSAKWRHGIEDF
ncbi:glycoside hydrolase family 13 protein [Pseudocercospora fijiensis CIRAD86]|uniref:alpha-amylase n=1 Tax=Pseudocercospora fijiensis (strain CIRAD86) TaxID=383855 RepID=M2YY58_PSEFD|nr:glycoside hydrolase family 13 protein [Pseudocercospora fijiensis CIRAD86]EME82600.1 glycoside hydrolase family 13 protein [Pseudocercospora fijiensis CIRAD86]